MNEAERTSAYWALNQLIDFCRRRRKDCNDCPIAFECSYVRRGLKPGDLLGFDTDDDD